ncbi:MAG: manganese efflux pump MntP family protein [Lachnospiraceae bacterium]
MTGFELFIIAVGLSMDAFAMAVCKGLSIRRVTAKVCITVAMYFAVFQGIMPLIGYTAGSYFAESIKASDHWIAFVLLGIIGGKMIKDSFDRQDHKNAGLGGKEMLVLAIATSIDALAVGISFAFLHVNIILAAFFISCITFVLTVSGVLVGNVFGIRFKAKAELAGGIILIVMGTKILIQHLGIMPVM